MKHFFKPVRRICFTAGTDPCEEFLDGFGLSQLELSKRTGIPRSTINEIVKGKRPINAETAYALGLFFRMEPQFWINLQSRYDLRRVELEKADSIRARVQPLKV